MKQNEYDMRIYSPDANGCIDHDVYSKVKVNINEPFPLKTFLVSYDYAIENKDGSLRWFNEARKFNGKEYCNFHGQENYETRGDVIWRR